MACPKWGDGSLWGDGDLYCSAFATSERYQVDVSGLSLTLQPVTNWNLQSPDGSIWTPSISTSQQISFTSGTGTVSAVPVVLGQSGVLWTPSISNAGVITLTSGASYTGVEGLATFEDSNGLQWFWQINATDGSYVGTSLRHTVATRFFRLSLKLKYTAISGISDSDAFRAYRIQPVVGIRAQLPDRYYALADRHVVRCSLKIKHGGSALTLSNLRVVAQVRKANKIERQDTGQVQTVYDIARYDFDYYQ